MDMVVAHYNERLNWLSFTSNEVNTIVYSKSQTPPEGSIVLPNEGRESQTYLYHIIENYNQLSEWTIFTQGYPFDHSPDFIHKTYLDPSKNTFMNQSLFLPISRTYPHLTSKKYDDPFNIMRNNSVKETWKWLYPNQTIPNIIVSIFGAIFVVNKSLLRSKPIDFYQELLTMHKQNYVMPWVMENLWAYLFVPYSPKICKLHL